MQGGKITRGGKKTRRQKNPISTVVQNLKKVLKSKISKFFSFLRHDVPFQAKNNREAVVVCAIHVVKRPSMRSVLVEIKIGTNLKKIQLLKEAVLDM